MWLEVVTLRDDSTQYTNQNMIEKLCHIMDKLRESCKPRSLNILVGRQFPQNGSSDLHVIKLTGEQNIIDSCTSIGSGSVYSNKLICNYWDNSMNMKEFAKLSYCILKFIERGYRSSICK
jgi:20S proteasome alpha/beta subunit